MENSSIKIVSFLLTDTLNSLVVIRILSKKNNNLYIEFFNSKNQLVVECLEIVGKSLDLYLYISKVTQAGETIELT